MTDTINRRRFPILLVTTLALLAILGALFLPGAAQAQSRNTYTSNLGEEYGWVSGPRWLFAMDQVAQAFHTGNRRRGLQARRVSRSSSATTAARTRRTAEVWLYDEFSDRETGPDIIFEFVARDIPSGTNNVRFDRSGRREDRAGHGLLHSNVGAKRGRQRQTYLEAAQTDGSRPAGVQRLVDP